MVFGHGADRPDHKAIEAKVDEEDLGEDEDLDDDEDLDEDEEEEEEEEPGP